MSTKRLLLPIRIALLLVAACCGIGRAGENLVRNPGFETPLEPNWQKRTPESKVRKLYRVKSAGRSGSWALALENLQPEYTRLRQGHDESISIEPGSIVEFSAWVKSDLTNDGTVTLQLYCMNRETDIRSQAMSQPITGRCDWRRLTIINRVSDDTDFVMPYLQMKDALGRVLFDDVELVVKRKPPEPEPAIKIGLLSDLPEDSPCAASLAVMLSDGLIRVEPRSAARQLADCAGALVLYESGVVPEAVLKAVQQYAAGGKPVFMDLGNFARWQGVEPLAVRVAPKGKLSLNQRMAAGIRVVKAGGPLAGFEVGQTMPRAAHPSGTLLMLPKDFRKPGLEVLAVGPNGEPAMVSLPLGKGAVTAVDVLSLREPFFRNVDAYYKYTPIANTLTNPVRLGEYYPTKLSYAEFFEQAKQLAASRPAIRFVDEGPASEGRRIFSLNLGQEGKPLYFLYAAAHGSEWEPGYGLLTFAKRIADGRLKDVIDLDRVNIKIVPYINPWGYDNVRRQNAQGVDLNRQGDYRWAEFKGRDSNKDGVWSPGDYDWKGAAPFTEPESATYKAILDRAKNLYCVLDYHGNCSVTANKIGVLPATARPDNQFLATELQYVANRRLRGRHLLRQLSEDTVSQYLLDRVYMGGGVPFLMNTSMAGRYGVLIELTAGYGQTYGTVLQTDVTCELCRALFVAYPPPKN